MMMMTMMMITLMMNFLMLIKNLLMVMMMMMTLGGYEAGSPQPWGGLARSSSPTAARPYSYISSHILSYLIISCHLFSFPLIFFLSLAQPSPLHCSNVSWNSISPLFFVFPWQSCTFPGLLFNFSKQPKLFLLCSEIASQAGEIIWTTSTDKSPTRWC